jgi:hypothetical protein
MRRNLWTPLLAVIAAISGLIVLLGYFVELPLLANLRTLVLEWAMILAAVALVIGVLNLSWVHWRKIRDHQPNNGYSIVLLISLAATIAVIITAGSGGSSTLWIYENILLPVETSLMAILAVVLLFALGRMFYYRANLFTVVFASTVLLIMVSTYFATGFVIPGLNELRGWILQVWAVAGTRGILLGVALGTIATGLRVLMGADRPYGG